ncbi:flavodoxin domain-containing protein [Modestobacter sp. NPDC049651]|uniref:flavodoxin domain-containing protein n=1 Tax=unclassified Modestobacter TaxID=2643866 RepID=UPI0033C41592
MDARPGPRVLVAVASRHGATAELAVALARDLERSPDTGSAVCLPVAQAPDPAGYDAVVLGSAVYAGRWLEPARAWAMGHLGRLRERPVWLFSSGPIGAPPFPPDEPHDVAVLGRLLGSTGHRLFPGRLDPARLDVGERAVVTAMRAPVGDFRDWPSVTAWAAEIAAVLAAGRQTAPATAPPG